VTAGGALTRAAKRTTLGGVKILIRNPRRREVELQGRRQVGKLLRELSLSEESHLVIRGDDVLTRDEWVEDDDHVEILSAVSGGAGCAA
jgi:sulfur carrier protein